MDDAGKYGRGGLLPMAVFLTQNAPGLAHQPGEARLLGGAARAGRDDSAAAAGRSGTAAATKRRSDLPLRDMLAQHRANPVCAAAMRASIRFGLAFEGYGPVGETRTKDLAGRPVDAQRGFPGGSEGTGFEGVQAYIREQRAEGFRRQSQPQTAGLCAGPVADALRRTARRANGSADSRRTGIASIPLVETIVTSPQFLNKRSPLPGIRAGQQKGE